MHMRTDITLHTRQTLFYLLLPASVEACSPLGIKIPTAPSGRPAPFVPPITWVSCLREQHLCRTRSKGGWKKAWVLCYEPLRDRTCEPLEWKNRSRKGERSLSCLPMEAMKRTFTPAAIFRYREADCDNDSWQLRLIAILDLRRSLGAT